MAVNVKLLQDGPLLVEGECTVTDAQGNAVATQGDKIFLCRCGSSSNKPFCDGTHKKVGFKS